MTVEVTGEKVDGSAVVHQWSNVGFVEVDHDVGVDVWVVFVETADDTKPFAGFFFDMNDVIFEVEFTVDVNSQEFLHCDVGDGFVITVVVVC